MTRTSIDNASTVLRAAARAVPWDLRIEVQTDGGLVELPVRHPDRIEPDGVREHPGGLLGLLWVCVRLVRRLLVGADTSNRATERRIRRAVLGAFDEPFRSTVAKLGMLDILQISAQIEEAQIAAVQRAREAARAAIAEREKDAFGDVVTPSPAAGAAPSPSGGEGHDDGPIVRRHPDGTKTTLFPIRVGKAMPGQLTGGEKVIYGVPRDTGNSERNSSRSAQPDQAQSRARNSDASILLDHVEISARNSSNSAQPNSAENSADSSARNAQPDPSESSARNSSDSAQPDRTENSRDNSGRSAQSCGLNGNPRTAEGCG